MFKATISRDSGEPWGPTGMSSVLWLDVPDADVAVADLIATQPGLLIDALIAPTDPVGHDPLPHVIAWRGQLYLEDGHHRVARQRLAGATHVRARILTLPDLLENTP